MFASTLRTDPNCIRPHSGLVLENSDEGKLHPLGRDLDIDLLIHLLQKETWPEGRIYMALQAVVNDSTGCSGAWEEKSWKIGNKEDLGRKMWMKDMQYEDLSIVGSGLPDGVYLRRGTK